MGKFKVGDEARLNCARGKFKIGDIVKVIETDFQDEIFPYLIKNENETGWTSGDSLEKVNTKKQRIEALEKRVGELELIVHELRGRKQQFGIRNLTIVEPSTGEFVEDRPFIPEPTKTPNQLRAEIIEKAKGFVEKYLTSRHYGYGFVDNNTTPTTTQTGPMKYKFVVNTEKRTVVAIGALYYTGGIYDSYKGIAKCNPSDVFNEHIGKAIALGRALGLDVSEFEGAVQPNEVVKGHEIKITHEKNEYSYLRTVGAINDNIVSYIGEGSFDSKKTVNTLGTIINDTNAIYGEVE